MQFACDHQLRRTKESQRQAREERDGLQHKLPVFVAVIRGQIGRVPKLGLSDIVEPFLVTSSKSAFFLLKEVFRASP